MAYQAKKKKRFVEIFELLDENDNVVHSIRVDLDADDVVVKIGRKYNELVRALAETTEMKRKAQEKDDVSQAFDKLGRAVIDTMESVFGAEDTETIVDFYEGRYVEMAKAVLPFINQCVLPTCIEMRKENQNSILSSYNRKQRRMIKRYRK